MQEVLKNQPMGTLNQHFDYLLDTCFIVWCFEHQNETKLATLLANHACAITSFNLEELKHIKISSKTKQDARHFFKNNTITILQLAVSPGNFEAEKKFVHSIASKLAKTEHDMSDAVLLAAGIKTKASILTRDRHDIFNTRLENFLKESNIHIYNTFPK